MSTITTNYFLLVSLLTSFLYLGNKSTLTNKKLDENFIQSKQSEVTNLNNVQKAEKKIEDDDESNECFDIRNCCQNLISRSFTKKQLNRKLPITDWLPKYNVECFVSDLIAGITVGLTVIPQGIAYALVAELPPQVC